MIGIGTALRQAREEQGFSLKDMQKKTNIQIDYLQSLEEERFDQLPSPFYARGFLRAYAKSLKLDAAYLLGLYEGTKQQTGKIQLQQAKTTAGQQTVGSVSQSKVHTKKTVSIPKTETFAPRRDIHKLKRKKQNNSMTWIMMAVVIIILIVIGVYFSFS